MMDDERDFEALWRIACAENEDLRRQLGGPWLRFDLPKMPTGYDVLHFIEKRDELLLLFCNRLTRCCRPIDIADCRNPDRAHLRFRGLCFLRGYRAIAARWRGRGGGCCGVMTVPPSS